MSRILTLAARHLFDRGDSARLKKLSFDRADIDSALNIPYCGDGEGAHLLDIYRLKDGQGEKPLLICIHGGGLFSGYKEINRGFCDEFVRRDYDVVNLNYRRIPEVTLEQQLEDLLAALHWIEACAAEQRLNTRQVYLVGDSAGALLCCLTLGLHLNTKFQRTMALCPTKLHFCGVGLISVMLDTKRDDFMKFINSEIVSKHCAEERRRYLLDPQRIFDQGLWPPVFLFTSAEDQIRKDTLKLADKLRATERPFQLLDWPKGTDYRLGHVFAVQFPMYPESQRLIDAMTDYFQGGKE
ncbi:MAG: alpha/beta hydrolase [Lachnospiraceae bacterium]|nr:alpha/beta hydrolase [Lachnospiraceae bacterium]